MLHQYTCLKPVVAFSTNRHGGVSKGAYASFNANMYCGDNPADVEKNRELLCERLGVDKSRLIIPHQTHSTNTMVVNEALLSLPDGERAERLEGVDAVCTNIPGVCVCVSTADCIPVLICDKAKGVVSAVHAGWRGTVARIVESNIMTLIKEYGTNPADCIAVVGPGISLDAFEVGDEVYDEFRKAGFDMNSIARRYPVKILPSSYDGTMATSKWHIDLPMCNKLQLLHMGLKEENIVLSGICTYTQSVDFFSARKLTINSGRILNGIMLNNPA